MSEAKDLSTAKIEYLPAQAEIVCTGYWTIKQIHSIESSINKLIDDAEDTITLNGKGIINIDSAGAMLLFELISCLIKKGKQVKKVYLSEEGESLLELISLQRENTFQKIKIRHLPNFFYFIGKQFIEKLKEGIKFVEFIGLFFDTCLNLLRRFCQPAWKSVAVTIEEAGYQAVPIVSLLTFSVGVVLTFQIALRLVSFGIKNYIVDLTGFVIFREFGPLITAIIAAARTSTAFAAQIGTMKINEEIDALKTMGVSPIERLVIPKVIGLLVVLPLLTVLADVFGVIGAMLMAEAKLDIGIASFIDRFQQVVEIKQFVVGLIKVPVFAVIVTLVGCFQGLQVDQSADNVGKKTTKAAVQAIFLIIITDALFSVFFSIRGI